jgi:DNA-binding transcriptional MerR regulator
MAIKPNPISISELRQLLRDCEDATLMRVRDTGASLSEVREAMQWLEADEDIGGEIERGPRGVVAEVCEILRDDDLDPEEI